MIGRAAAIAPVPRNEQFIPDCLWREGRETMLAYYLSEFAGTTYAFRDLGS